MEYKVKTHTNQLITVRDMTSVKRLCYDKERAAGIHKLPGKAGDVQPEQTPAGIYLFNKTASAIDQVVQQAYDATRDNATHPLISIHV